MGGTTEGGLRAAATVRQRYGNDYYRLIGAMGGRASHGGGFALDHDLARRAGSKGGRASRRRKEVA